MGSKLCWQNQKLCPLAQARCRVPPRGSSPLLCSEGFINQRASVLHGYRPHQAGITEVGNLHRLTDHNHSYSVLSLGMNLSTEENGMEIGKVISEPQDRRNCFP